MKRMQRFGFGLVEMLVVIVVLCALACPFVTKAADFEQLNIGKLYLAGVEATNTAATLNALPARVKVLEGGIGTNVTANVHVGNLISTGAVTSAVGTMRSASTNQTADFATAALGIAATNAQALASTALQPVAVNQTNVWVLTNGKTNTVVIIGGQITASTFSATP